LHPSRAIDWAELHLLAQNNETNFRWKQAVDEFPDFGMAFNNPDFVKYAEAYGAKGTRVNAVNELRSTLENAFASGGVHLIVVPIDYSEN
jgi:acetolactate synthase-1/2/3 large subunit